MPGFIYLTPDEAAMEQAADDLIALAARDPERPAYSERQLARHGERLIISLDRVSEAAIAEMPQSFRDELRFLASISHLKSEARRVLRFWIDGWTQTEIAEAFQISQQFVSRRLRRALRICYENAPVTFRQFSFHTISQPRRRSTRPMNSRVCLNCGYRFNPANEPGRYCSETCKNHYSQRRKKC